MCKPCPACAGTGDEHAQGDWTGRPCPLCEGTGEVEHTTNAFGTMEWRVVGVEEGTEDGS